MNFKDIFQRAAFVATFYSGTFLPEVLLRHKHWHFIQDGLMLGGIPIDSSVLGYGNHREKIMKDAAASGKKLGAVFSIVNEFEIQGKGLGMRTVSPKQWTDNGVEHHLIPMDDFGGDIDPAQVKETVDKMKAVIDRGESVYVHCKAGKGRSFSFIVAYLLVNSDLNVTEIFELIRQQRPQVSPSAAQFNLIEAFRAQYCPEKAPLNKESKVFESYRKGLLKHRHNPVVQGLAVGLVATAVFSLPFAALAGAGIYALSTVGNKVFSKFEDNAYHSMQKNDDISKLTLDQLKAAQSGMECASSWKAWSTHLLDLNATKHYGSYRGGLRLQREKEAVCQDVPALIATKERARAKA